MESDQKQKIERSCRCKNRYCTGAKLSEHRFLRLLRGYADGVPIAVLEPTTHTSSKTIRCAYRTFRAHLPLAAQQECYRFSRAGAHLFETGHVSTQGARVLSAIERTRRFSRYVKRHAPRAESDEDLQLLLIEKAVRIFCALDLRELEVDERVLEMIGEAFTYLRTSEPLANLAAHVPKARPYAHHGLRLYEDYRHHLLAHPLGTSERHV